MSLVISSAASVLAESSTPKDIGGPYVVAAYIVFIVVIAAYVAIMAQRLRRVAKQAEELTARLDAVQSQGAGAVQDGQSEQPAQPPVGASS